MCLQGAFGGLLVGSSTGKTKWPGLQILQQAVMGHSVQCGQQSMGEGSDSDVK